MKSVFKAAHRLVRIYSSRQAVLATDCLQTDGVYFFNNFELYKQADNVILWRYVYKQSPAADDIEQKIVEITGPPTQFTLFWQWLKVGPFGFANRVLCSFLYLYYSIWNDFSCLRQIWEILIIEECLSLSGNFALSLCHVVHTSPTNRPNKRFL